MGGRLRVSPINVMWWLDCCKIACGGMGGPWRWWRAMWVQARPLGVVVLVVLTPGHGLPLPVEGERGGKDRRQHTSLQPNTPGSQLRSCGA